jgi:hypothetical protein
MSSNSDLLRAMRLVLSFFVVVACSLIVSPASAGEPGWSPVIIATGDYRKEIESLPIEQRPYRPLHFYGNTVRRIHYRGTPLPIPQGLGGALRPVSRNAVDRPIR